MVKTLEIKATLIEKNENKKPEPGFNGHVGLLDIGSRYYLVQAPTEIGEDAIKKINAYSLLRNLLEDSDRRGITTQEVNISYTRP